MLDHELGNFVRAFGHFDHHSNTVSTSASTSTIGREETVHPCTQREHLIEEGGGGHYLMRACIYICIYGKGPFVHANNQWIERRDRGQIKRMRACEMKT